MTLSECCGRGLKAILIGAALVVSTGCAHKPPTIAHTHIGHAVTAFDGTPEEKGLFTVAEQRASTALREAESATNENNNLNDIQRHVRVVVETYGGEDFGIKQAMDEAANHIEFAATSADASANVKRAAGEVRTAANGILSRSDLITLLGNDVLTTDSFEEAQVLSGKIRQLAETNVNGGEQGEYGVTQIRKMIDDMINAEDPTYVTVDRWYLFHLVRLPDCDTCWAWRKWANSSNRGY
jgi:hypothetical protein